ncbi:MAG TPA: isoprenylcysteine carboxylmethyltransferase family protein [Acetobacteraceae bacterium]
MTVTFRMALLTTFGTAAYLLLAVLGEGGFAACFSHPPIVIAALVTIASATLALFTRGNLSSGEQEDRGNRWVLIAFAVLGVLAGWLPAYTDRIGFWTLDGDTIRWIGLVMFIAGCALRMWPVYVLGNRFSGLVAIQSGHTLVTTGIYRIIRHPSYLGMLVTAFGWALVFRAGAGVVLAALIVVPLIARIHSEEAMLRSHFGAEYDAYRARTWRLVPGLY